MSFLTGTNTELIYSSLNVGTAKNTFTTEVQINDTAGMGVQAHLPPDFWLANNNQPGRGVKIIAQGILSSTATPTYTFTVRAGGAGLLTGAILLGSTAITTATTVTNQYWRLEGEVVLTAIGAAGTNSTVRGIGYVMSPGFAAATLIQPVYGGGASPGTATNLDTSVTNYINFNVACGTSSASNSITLQSLQVFGLN